MFLLHAVRRNRETQIHTFIHKTHIIHTSVDITSQKKRETDFHEHAHASKLSLHAVHKLLHTKHTLMHTHHTPMNARDFTQVTNAHTHTIYTCIRTHTPHALTYTPKRQALVFFARNRARTHTRTHACAHSILT